MRQNGVSCDSHFYSEHQTNYTLRRIVHEYRVQSRGHATHSGQVSGSSANCTAVFVLHPYTGHLGLGFVLRSRSDYDDIRSFPETLCFRATGACFSSQQASFRSFSDLPAGQLYPPLSNSSFKAMYHPLYKNAFSSRFYTNCMYHPLGF